MFRTRLVVYGYLQNPGVDCMDNYAIVISNIIWQILLVLMLIWKLDRVLINMETSFLHGGLDKDIYMEFPKGYKIPESNECLKLENVSMV